MREDLRALLEAMLHRSSAEAGVSIDEVGDALTRCGVSAAEVEDWMTRFEDAGGLIRAPSGGGGAERLKRVLASARALARSLGRTPTVAEIAKDTTLDVVHVRWALALGRTMGR
jgi:transposase